MVKVKNKRNSGLADKVHNKKKADTIKKKLNPFEVHINKEKHKVLGKKSKHDRGLPGVARAKANQKRKETLGVELKLMNKTNTFIDRRIGEKNGQLTAEDKMVARFAAERARQHNKKNIYNLADDEILTHRGQTLEQIEKFDDPRSSDDEDDERKKFGGLQDDFVSEGHFGGGMLSKTEKDGAKSHKDLIEQLIAESKKRKAEKQKEKEHTLDLTEKLDSEWKDLQPVVLKKSRVEDAGVERPLTMAEKTADYDQLMRELRFERRGTPSDGLKKNEKAEREERQQLEQLEKEREQRMLGEHELTAPRGKQAATKHRSADDLDDNFELEDEKQFMLAYDNDGKPLVPESVLKDYSVPNAKPKFNDGVSDTSSDDDGDDESEDDGEKIEAGDENTPKVVDGATGGKEDTKFDDNDDSGSSETDDEDEMQVKEKPDEKGVKEVEEQNGVLKEASDSDKDSSDEEESDVEEDEDKMKVDDLKDLKMSDQESDAEMEAGDTEKIESFFDLKTTEGENLKELLSDKTPSQQSLALQKLIKSYDPSLSENNKEKLSRLYAHMLQYIHDIFTGLTNEGDVIKSFLIFDKLAPFFYDLSHTNKVSAKKYLAELLKEKHESYKKNPKKVPDLNTLVFFKLVSLLYPTSDFRHPVTTPSLIFMSEILTTAKFNNTYSISRGLFLVSLILEYTAMSKRYVPSAINFLRGILYLSANISVLNPVQVVPPFKIHRDAKILNLEDDCSKMDVQFKMAAKDLVLNEIGNDFKIRSLVTSSVMLKEVFNNCNDLEAQQAIFEPHLQLYSRIDLEIYPKKVASIVTKIVQHMKESLEVKTYSPLSREKKKPKALRLYEPDVQEVFTGSKTGKMSREQAGRRRLEVKVKKEMKGALREIRRDKAYIAALKIRQKIHNDEIRKEKVKQIYKDASIQQGEINKFKRMK